ncbi:MAG: hypothetical protein ACFCUO_11295 [Rhodospirillales bacterium]
MGFIGVPSCRRLRRVSFAVAAIVWAAAAILGPSTPASADAAQATEKLFAAIHANDFAAAQASVEAGARVDTPGRWGMTAIELAVDKKHYKIAHYLVAVRNFQGGGEGATPATANAAVSGGPSPAVGPADPRGTADLPSFYAPLAEPETLAGRPAAPDGPSWPAGTPNPFDPEEPAVGAHLRIIGEIGTAPPGLALQPAAGDPPMAADAQAMTEAPSGDPSSGFDLGSGVIGETRRFQ